MNKGAIFFVFVICFAFTSVFAQADVLDKKISLKVKKQTIPQILKLIEEKAQVNFSYNVKIIPEGVFNLNVRNEELNVILVTLLQPHKLSFSVLFGNNIVISKPEKKIVRYTVSGYVFDEITGEKMIGVTVYNFFNLIGTHTNQDGFYSLTLPSDSILLVYSTVGFKTNSHGMQLKANTSLNMNLNTENEFPNFIVTSKPDNETNFKPDEFHLNGRTFKQLPVLFGESDVLKSLQLLPGVSSGNDGTIGLNIRGGGPDQNLILLDDVPVYNPSHIYGFFSVFNSDVVKDVKLMKGGISSRYAGRLSSVIDVRTLDGNTKKLKVQASIGVLSSKLAIDGPIDKKKKTTILLAARRSYFDVLNSLANVNYFNNRYSPLRSGYFFYDANGKINHKFNDKHNLSLSFYTGMDNSFIRNSFSTKDPEKVIRERDRQNVFWGNKIYSLRYHHILGPKMSAWVNLSYSSYNFGNESNYEYTESSDSLKIENSYSYRFISQIENTILTYNIEYKPLDWLSIKAGTGAVLHEFDRNINSSSNNIQQNQVATSTKLRAFESNGYVDVMWKLRRKFTINTGVHYSQFNLQSTSYSLPQPRVSFNYKPVKNLLFHGAYQRTMQFLHLLTNANIGMPIDLWLPSTKRVSPENANMISGGLSYTRGDYLLNLEGFNKNMNNIIEYKEQANYIGSDNDWEDKITTGRGWAYGMELLAEKRNGKTRGWVSYTLSWNYRQFDQINNGKVFPYKYDRRHNIACLISHEFNKNIDASVSWMFTTGANFTLPEQVYYINSGLQPNNVIYVYGDRNNYKFPNYHRLDFGVNFKKFRNRYSRIFSVGAYNVYNRLNPFYINPAYNDKGERIFEAISLFPVLPSINYKIIF
jgi:outer membrane cobalamin receptor